MRRAGWIVLVCLLAAHVPAGAQEAAADLVAERVEIVGTPPHWIEGVAQDARFEAVVHNNGRAATSYIIEYWWVQDGQATPLHGAAANSFNVSTGPLGPGERATHRETWRLQPGQERDGELEVRVVMGKDVEGQAVVEPTANNVVRRPVHVALHDVRLSIAGASLAIAPEDVGFFRIQVHNHGSVAADVALNIAQGIDDPRIIARIEPDVIVAEPGRVTNSTLYVEFQPAGDFRAVLGAFAVQADPGFGSRPEAQTPQVDASAAHNPPARSWTAAVAAPTWSVPAGQQRAATIAVHNDGEGQDSHTLTWSGPPGWQASVLPDRIALFPGETEQVRFTVAAPADAEPGDAAFSVTLHGMSGQQTFELPWKAAGPAPHVRDIALPDTAYVGRPAKVIVALENPGDEATAAGNLRLTLDSAAGQTILEQQTASLHASGAREHVFMVDEVGPGGPLDVHASWSIAPQAGAAQTFMVHAPAVSITAPQPVEAQGLETVAYRILPNAFTIRNTGNAVESFDLEASARHGIAHIEGTARITLAPGVSRTIPVTHSLPAQGTSDRLFLNVTLEPAQRTWASHIDTQLVDRTPPVISPSEIPSHWKINTPLGLRLDIVESGGIQQASVGVTDPTGNHLSVPMLVQDGAATATVQLRALGAHSLSFSAVDAAGNHAQPAIRRLESTAYAPPRLAWDAPPSNISSPTPVVLPFQVDAEIPLVRLWLEIDQDGEQSIHDLALDARRVTVGEGLHPGPVKLTLNARDDHGSQGKASITMHWPSEELAASPPAKETPALLPLWPLALAAGARRRRC